MIFTSFAFANLLFISFVQSLFYVRRLPKYTNFVTLSPHLALLFPYLLCLPQIPLLLFYSHLFLVQPIAPLYLVQRHFLAISHSVTNQCCHFVNPFSLHL